MSRVVHIPSGCSTFKCEHPDCFNKRNGEGLADWTCDASLARNYDEETRAKNHPDDSIVFACDAHKDFVGSDPVARTATVLIGGGRPGQYRRAPG